MQFVLFLGWWCHLVRGDKDALKSLPVVESAAGKRSQGGSSCPGRREEGRGGERRGRERRGGERRGREGAPVGCWRLWAAGGCWPCQMLAKATQNVGW